MTCPHCHDKKAKNKIIDSRITNTLGGEHKRRRRKCCKCEKRFTTYEYVDLSPKTSCTPGSKKRGPKTGAAQNKKPSDWLEKLQKKLDMEG